VDSDEEWEEEEPGESLHGSDDEKEKEEEDDYDIDNDFFVPHGYLSEDEAQPDEKWVSILLTNIVQGPNGIHGYVLLTESDPA